MRFKPLNCLPSYGGEKKVFRREDHNTKSGGIERAKRIRKFTLNRVKQESKI